MSQTAAALPPLPLVTLPHRSCAEGFRVLRLHVPSTPSTMEDARAAAEASAAETPHKKLALPLIVTAASQTSGRGSTGRQWESPSGNVYLTVALPREAVPPDVLPVLPLLVGVALVEALRSLVPDGRRTSVGTKWPNDVLLDRRKLSGTIVESCDAAFLVGIGVNVAVAPPVADGGRAAAALHDAFDAADVPSATAVAEAVSAQLLWRVCGDGGGGGAGTLGRRHDVIAAYGALMDRGCPVYRRLDDGQRGGEVRAVRLGPWGELVVRDASTGEEETLVATYLF